MIEGSQTRPDVGQSPCQFVPEPFCLWVCLDAYVGERKECSKLKQKPAWQAEMIAIGQSAVHPLPVDALDQGVTVPYENDTVHIQVVMLRDHSVLE